MRDFASRVMDAPLGKTHLFAVGQAGYIIKSRNGQLLAIDLYLSTCVERVEGNTGYKRLLPQILTSDSLKFDIVICTHPHLDHFDVDAVPSMMCGGNTELYCSKHCAKLVDQMQMGYYKERITYVAPGDTYCHGDFKLSFVNCDHGQGAPDAVGVVICVDGKVIYETGDTCLRLDRIDELPKHIDVLIAPINGAYGNLNEVDCTCLAEAIQPSITIPCHYGMFASHHGDVGKFYELMMEKQLPFLLMGQGEQYTL